MPQGSASFLKIDWSSGVPAQGSSQRTYSRTANSKLSKTFLIIRIHTPAPSIPSRSQRAQNNCALSCRVRRKMRRSPRCLLSRSSSQTMQMTWKPMSLALRNQKRSTLADKAKALSYSCWTLLISIKLPANS